MLQVDAPTSGTFIWTVPRLLYTDGKDIRLYARDASRSNYYYTHSIVFKIHGSASASDSSSLTPVGTPTVADSSSSTASSTATSDSTTHTINVVSEIAEAPTDQVPDESTTTTHQTDTDPTPNPTTPNDNPTQTPEPPSTSPTMSTSTLAGTVVSCFLVFSSLLTITLVYVHRRGRRKRLSHNDAHSNHSNPEADGGAQAEIAELDSPLTQPPWGASAKEVMSRAQTQSVPSSAVTLGPGLGGSPLSPAEGRGQGWERGGVAVHELSTDGAVMAQPSWVERSGRQMVEHGTRSLGMGEAESQAGGTGEVGVARMVWVGPRRTV